MNQVKKDLMAHFGPGGPGGASPKAADSFTHESGGWSLALSQGIDGDVEKSLKQIVKSRGEIGWQDVTVAPKKKVEYTYAFDQANQNPRSGKVVVLCRIYATISGTKNGQPRSDDFVIGTVTIEVHDSTFEQMSVRN